MAGPGGQEVGRVSIRVLPDTSSFSRSLKGFLEKMEARSRLQIPAELDINKAKAAAEVKLLARRLGAGNTIHLDVDIDRAGHAISAAASSLAAMTSLASTAATAMSSFGGSTSSAASSAGSLSSALASTGTRVGAIASVAVGAASAVKDKVKQVIAFTAKATVAITAASVALGSISTIVAGLPALAATGGAALAAIALGFEGIKRAAQSLKGPLDDIKARLSETFETGLTPVFERLRKTMPVISDGLNGIALELIDMADGFSRVATSGAALGGLRAIFANIKTFLDRINPGIQNLAAGFANLALEGSEHLRFLGSVINDIGERWRNTVRELSESGDIKAAFKGLAQAADGVSFALDKLFRAGIKIMDEIGPPLRDLFKQIGKSVEKLAEPMGKFSGEAIELFENLIRIATPLADVFMYFLTPALEGLNDILRLVAPVFERLAKYIKEKMTPELMKKISDAWNNFKSKLKEALPVIEKVAKFFIDNLLPALPTLIEFFGNLALAALGLGTGFLAAAGWGLWLFNNVLDPLRKFFTNPLDTIAKWVDGFVGNFKRLDKESRREVLQMADGVFSILGGLPGGALLQMLPFPRAVKGPIKDAKKGATKTTDEMGNDIISRLTGIPPGAVKALRSLPQKVTDKFNEAKDRAVAAVQDLVERVTGWFGRVIPQARRALGNAGHALYSAGAQLVHGFLNGIAGAWGSVTSWLGNAVSNLVGWVQSRLGIRSPSRVFMEIGAYTAQGMAIGIRNGTPGVIRAADRMASKAERAAHGQWNGTLRSESYGNFTAAVAEAVAGMSFTLDDSGGRVMARVVNRANRIDARRQR